MRNTDLTEIVKHRIVLFFLFLRSLIVCLSLCMHVFVFVYARSYRHSSYGSYAMHNNQIHMQECFQHTRTLDHRIDHRANPKVSANVILSCHSLFGRCMYAYAREYVQLCTSNSDIY